MRIKIVRKLRAFLPHQLKVHESYSKKEKHPLFFLEMRLGKTLLAIRWVKWLPCRPLRILVLAPSSVLSSWEKQLKLENEFFLVEYGTKARKYRYLEALELHNTDVTKRTWFLTNYQAVLSSSLHYLNWDVFIVDESTCISNADAKTTREVTKGMRNATHRAALSGMPNPESAIQLVSQYIAVRGDFMGYRDFYEWRARNCNKVCGQWFLPRPRYREVKKYLHQTACVLSRKQAGLGSRTVHEVRRIEMPPSLKRAYKEAKKRFSLEIEGQEFETKWQIVLETWLARLAGGFDPDGNLVSDHKYKELVYLLTGELAKEQVVVGFRFNAEIEHADTFLRKAGIVPSILWGATPAEKRGEVQERFDSRKDRVILLQSSLARYSFDLSASDTLIHYSRWYSNEINTQVGDRIIHPAKEKVALYLDLVTKGSIDEKVVAAAKSKKLDSKMLLTQFKEEWLSGR